MAKRYRYTVYGRGYFPFDMLRYDQAWPQYEEDATKFAPYRENSEIREIRLVGLNNPTIGRWISFGWNVKEVHSH